MAKPGELSVWKKGLFTCLDERLTSHGFRRTGATYYRSALGAIIQSVYINGIPHRMRDIDVVVHFGLRYEAVESILEGWPQNPDERSSRRATVGIEYGNLIGAGNWRWTIAKCEDVPVVCKEVADSIEKAGFQFFARLSTLEELMEVLITEGQRPTYCLDSTRATAIPVVAALLGRTDKLGEYCRYWWGRLQQNPNFPFHARAYPSFVEYLSHRFGVPIQID